VVLIHFLGRHRGQDTLQAVLALMNSSLPDAEPSPRTDVAAADPATILYVDDNVPNTRLVERIIERRPHIRLVCTMRGGAAVELAAQHKPRLILLDLHLPDIDGDEVLRLLHEDTRTAAMPVVIVSADAMPKQIERLMLAGATRYLTKPLRVTELLDVIDGLVPNCGTSSVTNP